MAKRVERLEKLKFPLRSRRIMNPEEVRKALLSRPESYGGKSSGNYSGANRTRLNAYGELLDEPSEPYPSNASGTKSGESEKYGKYGKHGKHGKYGANGKFQQDDDESDEGGLAGKVIGVFSLASFLASIFFALGNITGNAVASNNSGSASIFGPVLFVIGAIGAYFYFKK
jgi:hypothetical protein